MKVLAFALLMGAAFSPPDRKLDDSTFSEWKAYLAPKAQETEFCDVPWRPSFWVAIQEAQRERKPVLLWAMNGHPLGCT